MDPSSGNPTGKYLLCVDRKVHKFKITWCSKTRASLQDFQDVWNITEDIARSKNLPPEIKYGRLIIHTKISMWPLNCKIQSVHQFKNDIRGYVSPYKHSFSLTISTTDDLKEKQGTHTKSKTPAGCAQYEHTCSGQMKETISEINDVEYEEDFNTEAVNSQESGQPTNTEPTTPTGCLQEGLQSYQQMKEVRSEINHVELKEVCGMETTSTQESVQVTNTESKTPPGCGQDGLACSLLMEETLCEIKDGRLQEELCTETVNTQDSGTETNTSTKSQTGAAGGQETRNDVNDTEFQEVFSAATININESGSADKRLDTQGSGEEKLANGASSSNFDLDTAGIPISDDIINLIAMEMNNEERGADEPGTSLSHKQDNKLSHVSSAIEELIDDIYNDTSEDEDEDMPSDNASKMPDKQRRDVMEMECQVQCDDMSVNVNESEAKDSDELGNSSSSNCSVENPCLQASSAKNVLCNKSGYCSSLTSQECTSQQNQETDLHRVEQSLKDHVPSSSNISSAENGEAKEMEVDSVLGPEMSVSIPAASPGYELCLVGSLLGPREQSEREVLKESNCVITRHKKLSNCESTPHNKNKVSNCEIKSHERRGKKRKRSVSTSETGCAKRYLEKFPPVILGPKDFQELPPPTRSYQRSIDTLNNIVCGPEENNGVTRNSISKEMVINWLKYKGVFNRLKAIFKEKNEKKIKQINKYLVRNLQNRRANEIYLENNRESVCPFTPPVISSITSNSDCENVNKIVNTTINATENIDNISSTEPLLNNLNIIETNNSCSSSSDSAEKPTQKDSFESGVNHIHEESAGKIEAIGYVDSSSFIKTGSDGNIDSMKNTHDDTDISSRGSLSEQSKNLEKPENNFIISINDNELEANEVTLKGNSKSKTVISSVDLLETPTAVALCAQSTNSVHSWCAQHKSEMASHFCFTCNVLACRECVCIEHSGASHKVEIVSETNPKQLAMVAPSASGASSKNADNRVIELVSQLQENSEPAKTFDFTESEINHINELIRIENHGQSEMNAGIKISPGKSIINYERDPNCIVYLISDTNNGGMFTKTSTEGQTITKVSNTGAESATKYTIVYYNEVCAQDVSGTAGNGASIKDEIFAEKMKSKDCSTINSSGHLSSGTDAVKDTNVGSVQSDIASKEPLIRTCLELKSIENCNSLNKIVSVYKNVIQQGILELLDEKVLCSKSQRSSITVTPHLAKPQVSLSLADQYEINNDTFSHRNSEQRKCDDNDVLSSSESEKVCCNSDNTSGYVRLEAGAVFSSAKSSVHLTSEISRDFLSSVKTPLSEKELISLFLENQLVSLKQNKYSTTVNPTCTGGQRPTLNTNCGVDSVSNVTSEAIFGKTYRLGNGNISKGNPITTFSHCKCPPSVKFKRQPELFSVNRIKSGNAYPRMKLFEMFQGIYAQEMPNSDLCCEKHCFYFQVDKEDSVEGFYATVEKYCSALAKLDKHDHSLAECKWTLLRDIWLPLQQFCLSFYTNLPLQKQKCGHCGLNASVELCLNCGELFECNEFGKYVIVEQHKRLVCFDKQDNVHNSAEVLNMINDLQLCKPVVTVEELKEHSSVDCKKSSKKNV